jgi:hypothetical protein
MPPRSDNQVYEALALPNEAIADGGVEILRAGIINDELFVSARRAFQDPAQWGDVLADAARRLGLLYAAETDYTEKEVLGAIESAFAARLGNPPAKAKARRSASKGQAAKSPARKRVTRRPAVARRSKRRT